MNAPAAIAVLTRDGPAHEYDRAISALVAGMEVVLEIHGPKDVDGRRWCTGCLVLHPCPTAKALGVEG